MNKQTILITGVAGFLGYNFLNKIIKEYPDYKIIGIDKLAEEFTFNNLQEFKNYKFYLGDISDKHFIDSIFKIEKPNILINIAAESFVCKSIINAEVFIKSNVLGVQTLLDASIKYGIEKFIQCETDEVYGHLKLNELAWTEESICKPRNTYAASKLCGGLLVHSANQVHGLQYIITRSTNIFGPRQNRRNLLPMTINCIFNNQAITVFGDGSDRRCWDYVDNKCDAILYLLHNSPMNEIYNLGPGTEMSNLELVNKICNYFGKGKELIVFTEQRKGADFRYSVNCDKLFKLGYKPNINFEQGFEKTMEWYKNNSWYFKV